MKNTDFMNLSLPEGTDKIDVELLNSDFKKLEIEASKHYIKQQIEVDGTATIIGSIGPYVQLENLTDNILNVSIGDELVILMKGDNRKIRTVSGENYGVVTSGAVRITYYINAQTYADENFYKKEKVDELLKNVEATIEVDTELSETSENPVQNKAITQELANYATTAEVESKVTEKVAEIVAGAPEDFDTLKEMSDWLKEHEDSAASMNSVIEKNAADITTANTNITKNTEGIATANTNIQTNADNITAVKNDVAINQSTLGFTKKNLLKPIATSQTVKGIMYTVNDDKTITCAGTATGNSLISVGEITKAGVYTLTGCPSGGSATTYMLTIAYTKKDGTKTYSSEKGTGIKITFDTSVYNSALISIEIKSGVIIDNLVFSPMLRHADITDDTYEPYAKDVNTRLTALEIDTGWVDVVSNITPEVIAFDDTYTRTAIIRKIGKHVVFRGSFKFVSDTINDNLARFFLRGAIPAEYRPSKSVFTLVAYGSYTSSTVSTYIPVLLQITVDGAIIVFMLNDDKISNIYGHTLQIYADWLID